MANTTPDQGTPKAGSNEPRTGRQQTAQEPNKQSTTGQLADKAEQVAKSAEEKVKQALEQGQHVRERAQSAIDKQQSQLGERIRDVGGVLRSGSRKLDDDNQSVASLLNSASDQVDRLASYVDTASPRSVASDLHNFVHDRPAWVFGGAFLAGLALGRFLKASSRSSYPVRSRDTWQGEYASPRSYAAGQPSGRQYPAPRAQDSQTGGGLSGSQLSGSQQGGSQQSGSTSNVSINNGETP